MPLLHRRPQSARRPLAILLITGAVGAVAAPSPAEAACASLTPGSTLTPGATLALTCQTGGTGSPASGSTGTINLPTVPGSYLYGNGYAGPTSTIAGSPAPGYGFYDDYAFTVTESFVNSITSTIDLATLSVTDLQARLYSLGPDGLPTLGTPPGGVISSWSTPISGPGLSGIVTVIPQTALAAGTYVLEIRGNVTGDSGGSYSGTLNLTPVPLPAAGWLLVAGMAGLVSLGRRGRAASAGSSSMTN